MFHEKCFSRPSDLQLQLSYGQPWGNNSPLLLRIATGGTGKDSPLQRIRNESGHSRLSKSPSNGSDYSPRNSAGGKYLPLSRTSSTDSLNSGGPDQIVHPSLSPKKQQQLQHQQELVQRQLQAQQQQQQQHRVPSPDQVHSWTTRWRCIQLAGQDTLQLTPVIFCFCRIF